MNALETSLWIYALGFLGQGLFGARLIVQLYLSEKQGQVVSPTVFWLLSLGASFLFLLYGLIRSDLVIIVGQTISYFIYIRNLQLKGYWLQIAPAFRWVLLTLPIGCILLSLSFGVYVTTGITDLKTLLHPIMLLGAIGQLMLNLRFVYQWYFSEKENESLLPVGFWHISTWASVLVLIYATFHPIHGFDPVLLVAQGFGIIVYARNIFIFRKAKEKKDMQCSGA